MSGTIYRSSVACTLNWALHLHSVSSYKKIGCYLLCCSQPSQQEEQAACNAWGNTWTIKGRQRSSFLFLFYVHCLLHRISLQYLKNSNMGLLKVSSVHKSYLGENLTRTVSTDAAVIYSSPRGWEQKAAMVVSAVVPSWGWDAQRNTASLAAEPAQQPLLPSALSDVQSIPWDGKCGDSAGLTMVSLTLYKVHAHQQSVTGSAVQLAAHHPPGQTVTHPGEIKAPSAHDYHLCTACDKNLQYHREDKAETRIGTVKRIYHWE